MAELKWFGHACFRLSSREAKILMDPLPRSTGYRPDRQKVDIVTLSHDDPNHAYLDLINSDFKRVDGPGEYEMHEVFITGLRTFRDREKSRDLGF